MHSALPHDDVDAGRRPRQQLTYTDEQPASGLRPLSLAKKEKMGGGLGVSFEAIVYRQGCWLLVVPNIFYYGVGEQKRYAFILYLLVLHVQITYVLLHTCMYRPVLSTYPHIMLLRSCIYVHMYVQMYVHTYIHTYIRTYKHTSGRRR